MARELIVVGVALGVLAGCSSQDPESALARLIADAEVAAEAGDNGFFRSVISQRYADPRGNDRDRLLGMLRAYFLSHESIEMVSRVESIQINGESAGEIVLFAGILGRREGTALLSGLDGRLYRVELELVREGGVWQIIGAQWERSSVPWGGG